MINNADDADDDPRRTHLRLSLEASPPAENWDDDFEFQPRASDPVRSSDHDATNAPERVVHSHEQEESWDDAYEDEDPDASPVKRAPKVEDDDVEDWDSSDNEAHDEHEHEHERKQKLNHEPLREFGAGLEEEDKTVTARSSSSRVRPPPPPLPIPNLPAHAQHSQYPPPPFPFHPSSPPIQHPIPPTSPTLSSFSIPISSNRASIYSQDPLMPTASNSSAPHLSISAMRAYPQSAGSTPPRKGRRLRKKSRPPEADIFELEDREPDSLPIPEIPVTPPAPPSPPRPMTPPQTMNVPAALPTPSPSLLTRIGSLKRWARRSIGPDDPSITGWRRGKSSTGPSETGRVGKSSTGPDDMAFADESLEHDLRSMSPTPAPGKGRLRRSRGESTSGQKAGWFFRAGGGGGNEKEETSAPASLPVPAPVPARTPDPSPSKRGTLGLRRREKEVTGDTPTPKKAKGRLVPALRTGGDSVFQTESQAVPKSPVKPTQNGAQPRHGARPMSLQPQSMQFPRHHGSASVGRSAGAPLSIMISDAGIPPHEENGATEGREREGGMRSLMNGVRKLSLVSGAHKRTKSTGADAAAVEAVKKGEHTGTPGRPRSRTDDRPVSRASTTAVSPRPVSRSSTTGTGSRSGIEKGVHALLPPVELNSPSSSVKFERRGSLPWADYDPVTGASAGCTSPAGGPSMQPHGAGSPVPSNLLPNFSGSKQHHTERQSFSASATSLLTGSPTRPVPAPAPAPAPVSQAPLPQAPVTPQRSGTRPHSRPNPISLQATAVSTPALHAPPSPRTGATSATPLVPHSASLGRSATSPAHAGPGLRRNSLGDLKTQTPPRGELKIPARISRAQQGLRRDLGMVREFAGCVEQLKRLQGTYTTLLAELREAYEASPVSPASRPISPQTQFHLPSRPSSQVGTAKRTITVNPNPSMQSVHQATSLPSTSQLPSAISARPSQDVGRELARLEHEYGIWWECAELLVELGGGTVAGTASNPNLAAHSVNTPAGEPFKELDLPLHGAAPGLHVASMSEPGSIFEHALAEAAASKGPPQASPPHPSQWRASTGRHDLSARQLRLLKDMLNTPDPASLAYAAGPYGYGAGYPPPHSHPYAVHEGEDAQPWAPWNPSTVTLPSEESSADPHLPAVPYGRLPGASVGRSEGKEKKRRANRLGMLGLREILRSLKRNAVADGRLDGGYQHAPPPRSESSASANNSAEDDHYNRRRSPWHQHDEHHGAKPDASPEEASATLDVPPPRGIPPKSPRRPSLASIFRLGQKSSKNGGGRSKGQSSSGNGNSTTEDERDIDAGGGAAGEYSDWERMSQSDLDLTTSMVGSGTATVRGKRKVEPPSSGSNSNLLPSHSHPNANTSTPRRTPATSQTSLWETSPPSGTPPQLQPQSSKLPLSIAEEDSTALSQKAETPGPARTKKERTSSWSQANPARPTSRNGKAAMTGTVRSAPPTDISSMPDPKLALTPENIKPLLEYAREVSTRLGECIGEVQTLLSANALAQLR